MREERVQSVLKAFQIVDTLSHSDKTLTEIAKAVRLHVATARRLLVTLLDTEYVRINKQTKRYYLGVRFTAMGRRGDPIGKLRQIAMPYLSELMKRSNDTVNLVIEDSNQAVYIEQVECESTLRAANKVGSRAPLHCTAAGKILLAARPPAERRKYLETVSLTPVTPKTISSQEQLLTELEKVERTGIAIDNEEQMLGERCIASAVRNHEGAVLAAVSISGPSVRLTMERLKQLKPIILQVSSHISKQLEYEDSTGSSALRKQKVKSDGQDSSSVLAHRQVRQLKEANGRNSFNETPVR
jgi:DNA-binding IclR family transcriptional regulator